MVIRKKCCCCSLKKACMIIGTLGQIGCFFKIKSDVEQIMEDSMGQDTREDKINILMTGNEKLNIHINREDVANFVD